MAGAGQDLRQIRHRIAHSRCAPASRTLSVAAPGHTSRHDNGLWAGPYQPSARVRVTAPMVREILLAAGLTEHQPGTAGFLITDQPDGRIRVEPAPAAGESAPQRDAEHFRLERLRSLHREAVDRSCVIKEVDGLAYLLAPESLPQADPA